MGIIKRIAEGTTTVRDAQKVQDLHDSTKRFPVVLILIGLGMLLLGLAIGGYLF